MMENIQNRVSKKFPGLKKLLYSTRLKNLCLTTLSEGKVRGDLIQKLNRSTRIEGISNILDRYEYSKSVDEILKKNMQL